MKPSERIEEIRHQLQHDSGIDSLLSPDPKNHKEEQNIRLYYTVKAIIEYLDEHVETLK